MSTPPPAKHGDENRDPAASAARRAQQRDEANRDNPVTPASIRLAQIGVLGWTIVTPILLGLLAGHWLDRWLRTGVTFAAALLTVGAGLGMWFAWRWMHRQ
ncbi:MAG: ATP synthase subunit [Lysobacterales bacterium 14-68-21]|jgi:ATP synthase protein I|nr:MAG: ATP synthase subunit [Xanthomonadales bacterium 15-68-25]OZB63444.1 MAG: ATP synthase subunit [Xanthomonadales bacterium 14-68-21]